jgi:uncharacterized OB-fold protein
MLALLQQIQREEDANLAEVVKNQIPSVEGFFTWPSDQPRLKGTKCLSCGTYFFPKTFICGDPDCRDKTKVEEVLFGREGTLWTYTVQYYPPPAPFRAPEPFSPYAIGMVDLPEGPRITTMLTGRDPESWRIGDKVEMVVETMYEDENGNDVVTWKFRPAEGVDK